MRSEVRFGALGFRAYSLRLDSHLNMIPLKTSKKQREDIRAPQVRTCVFFQVGGRGARALGTKSGFVEAVELCLRIL